MEHIRKCPVCKGHQRLVTAKYMKQDPRCPVCDGRGVVSPHVCRGCSRPAFHQRDEIWYCGETKCYEGIRDRMIEQAIDERYEGYGALEMGEIWN